MQKIYRLKLNGSFRYIYRKGSVVTSDLLVLYKVPAKNLKIGISVGKKVGNSVSRSKVKRRISESFRLAIPNISHEFNFVVVARAECKDKSFAQINECLVSLLDKSGVLIEEKQ